MRINLNGPFPGEIRDGDDIFFRKAKNKFKFCDKVPIGNSREKSMERG
jgi:hypothetical protein